MIGPELREEEEAAAGRAAPRDGGPVASLVEDLQAHLEARRTGLLERAHESLWEPLRRSADRLGALRDQALDAEDPLRDAGRAVRMLCDELEDRDPAGELRAGLARHLDAVAEFAHTVPRIVEPTGPGAGAGTVAARGAVGAVLEADYPDALLQALDPATLVEGPARALPPSPADLLRPEDHSGRLTEAVDRAERHLRLVLEEAADRAVDEVEALLRGRRTLDRLRLRWRRARAPARRRSVEAALGRGLDAAAAELADLLETRRFTADLARRERALTEAAEEAADRLEEAAAPAERMRRLAGRIEEAGGSLASDAAPGEGIDAARLERLESGIREALDRVRASLPEIDRPDAELMRGLGRFVRLADALSGVGGREASRTPAARRPAAVRDRVSRAVPRVRDAVREASEIVGHGLRAARSESAVREPDPGVVAGLVRESCERAARKLRDATDLLEEALDGAASAVREAPERILAELRARDREGAGGPGEGWPARLRVVARRAVRTARGLRDRWLADEPAPEEGRAPERGAAAGRETAGSGDGEEEGEPSPAGFSALPAIYRWLFRSEPLDDPHLLVGRERDIERLRALRRRWEEGESAALAVVGSPGSGKTSLLNCGAAELESGAAVHRGRVDRRLATADEAVAWFARFFGVDGRPASAAELADALRGRRELVLLENGERLFRRQVGGYRAIRTLGELVGGTGGRVAWVVTFDREPWRVMTSVTGLARRFDGTLEMAALDRRELEEALLARHRLAGYDLRFAGSGDAGERRRDWFDRLHELSGGHPGRSLQIWRESLVATGPHEIRALPPRRPCPGRVGGLDRETLFVLAALMQHGDLPEEDLPGLLHATREEVDERLALLRREGLVRPVPGLPPAAPLQVDRPAYAEVERRLREAGLLVTVPGEEGTP